MRHLRTSLVLECCECTSFQEECGSYEYTSFLVGKICSGAAKLLQTSLRNVEVTNVKVSWNVGLFQRKNLLLSEP